MIITITKYGRFPLSLSYNDRSLTKIVEEYVSSIENRFKYSELNNYVLRRALKEGMLQVEPYTSYTQIVLSSDDEHRISLILWKMIWDKKLIIEFQDVNQGRNGDTFFGKVK